MIITSENGPMALYYVRFHASRARWRFKRGVARLKYRPVWQAYEVLRAGKQGGSERRG